ncbi:unnamed protein product [Linum tenue]|uniref:TITAN-like protein n=1 Tax=Linum tenue TaxID=586396 RepID=A0AAV0QT69_9ROSI|nr:unnamed protein product [Linum tenue]
MMKSADKKRKKESKKCEFEFCKVCNLNHDHGNRHKYFPNHTKSLSTFLHRFQTKLSDIRFFLRNPTILRPELASRNRFWCVVCDAEVDEIGSSFACANAINHLASADHAKKLKHFLWKYGGGMDHADNFRFSEADLAKWEKKCHSLNDGSSSCSDRTNGLQIGPSNDIQNELSYKSINDFENNNLGPLTPKFLNNVLPLQYNTHKYQISQSGHPATAADGRIVCGAHITASGNACSASDRWNSNNITGWQNSQHCIPHTDAVGTSNFGNGGGKHMAIGGSNLHGLASIAQVSVMAPGLAEGNVHTGAPPPWLEMTVEHHPEDTSVPLSSKKGKSKLNPKRVGAAWAEKRKAELEMEKRGEIVNSDCGPNWLPNFGRVWQSGSRKESLKEFESEKPELPKVEVDPEMPITLRPYVSKRMVDVILSVEVNCVRLSMEKTVMGPDGMWQPNGMEKECISGMPKIEVCSLPGMLQQLVWGGYSTLWIQVALDLAYLLGVILQKQSVAP